MSAAEEQDVPAVSILEVLREHVKDQEDGAVLGFVEVEQATGIRMDQLGRNTLRRACRLERRPYESIRNCGLRLSSCDNVVGFARNKGAGVARAAQRAQHFVKGLLNKHEDELRDSEKSELLRQMSVHGSVRQAVLYSAPMLPVARAAPDNTERTRGALSMVKRVPKKD